MKKFLVIGIACLPMLTMGQKNINLGKGILNIDFEKQPTINFYADTTQSTLTKTITVIKDNRGDFIIKDNAKGINWFKPEGLWLDYNSFVIRVDVIIGKWYKVFIDNEKGITLWTTNEQGKMFITWQTFLIKETTSIYKIKDFDLEIKVVPGNNAKTIKKIEKTDCFKAIASKGDWLRIKTNETLGCI